MSSIGRNDLCPCMSGKKYKKCCISERERDKFLKEQLNSQYIDGKYILEDLLGKSSILNKYIIEKFKKIHKPIIWLLNPELNANMRSISFGDAHGIIVKEVPIKQEDYFDVAHEIGHIILGELGYPMSNVKDGDTRKTYLSTILTNTVIDPIINKELKKYGFDFNSYMDKGIKIQVPILEDNPKEENLHIYDKHFLKCLVIEKILEWDLFDEQRDNPFEIICKDKYPTIYKEALKEIEYIRNLGTDTPEKVRIILSKILKDNMMENTIEII